MFLKPRLEVISGDEFEMILAAAPDSLIDPALEEELEAYIKSVIP